MGFAIRREPTAFSLAPSKGQKRPRQEDAKHLAWIRTLPCLITGSRNVQAAHVSYADPAYGKRERGKSEKADDRWAVPLSPDKHREQHQGNEIAFWAKHGIDPLKTALALYSASGDDELAETIIRNARQGSTLWQPGVSRGD